MDAVYSKAEIAAWRAAMTPAEIAEEKEQEEYWQWVLSECEEEERRNNPPKNTLDDEELDSDFCHARVWCENSDDASRVGAKKHPGSYKVYGWEFAKGFVFHSIQCKNEISRGKIFCDSCRKRKTQYEDGKNSSRSKWNGVFGELPVEDSHCKGSCWAGKVIAGSTP
jgi:hypothetical protein